LSSAAAESTIDISASLTAALLRERKTPFCGRLRSQDLRVKVFQQPCKRLIVFVVDASESMGEEAVERIKAAKGALLGWLLTAYQQRDQVALVGFRGRRARVLLRPTSSVLLARRSLRQLAIGGATPLADGLWQGLRLVQQTRQRQPGLMPTLVLVTDGEANVPYATGADIQDELKTLAAQLAEESLSTLVVDSSSGRRENPFLRELAAFAGGTYQHVRKLNAGKLFSMLRNADTLTNQSTQRDEE